MILGRPVQLGYETKIYQAARCPNHNGFGRQLSFLDIVEFRLLYTPGPTQGRILGDANGTCSCTGFWAPYHSYGLPLCQQRRTQFSVELRRDGLARATESGVLRKLRELIKVRRRWCFPRVVPFNVG